MNAIRVALVEDHVVFAETLAAAFAMTGDLAIVAVAPSIAEGERICVETQPDVAVVDIELEDGDGITLTERLGTAAPATRVLVLTARMDSMLLPKAMSAGASGFLLKHCSLSELTDAIRRVAGGETIVPRGIVARMTPAHAPVAGLGSDLTRRELEVLALLAAGSDARSMAKTLHISWQTARSYTKTILMKLDAHSQLEAVAKAVRLGIVTMDEGNGTR